MPRASKLYFAYHTKVGRTVNKIAVCKFDVGNFGDESIRNYKTIPVEEEFVFSGRKAYYRTANGQNMEVCDLITSKKEVLPDLPLHTVLGSPITIGKYFYMFGADARRNAAAVTNCIRFDTEKKSWETREPLPYQMKKLSAVEMNGLIYVAGAITSTDDYSSNFWCYNPNENVWTEKPHTCVEGADLFLRKIKESIFICNHFMIYDVSLNRWKKLAHALLWEDDMFEYELHDAIEFEGTVYGVCAVEDALSFKVINFGNNYCAFDSFEWDSSDMYGTDTSHFFIH